MTTSHTLPLVGMHFRPPAKAILAVLPVGCPLWLEPEPENPYDANALKVNVRSADIPTAPAIVVKLNDLAQPSGFTSDEIFAKPSWHLGYIPREAAAELASSVAEAFEINGEVQGKLSFDPAGRAYIAFGLPEAE